MNSLIGNHLKENNNFSTNYLQFLEQNRSVNDKYLVRKNRNNIYLYNLQMDLLTLSNHFHITI